MDTRTLLGAAALVVTLGGGALRVVDRVTTLQADVRHEKEQREKLDAELQRLRERLNKLQASQRYYHGTREDDGRDP